MSTQTSDDQHTEDSDTGAEITRPEYDAVIVGGGAAGLSAALMLVRARRRVLVVDSRAPRNAKADHMHGFLSRDGMSPLELLACGRDEVLSYGGVVVTDYVEKAERTEDGFHVSLASGCEATGRQLLVATGLTDVLPQIPGMRELWATDVHVCPYCHGWEVQDQALATVATGPFSTHHTLLLRQWTDDLVYFLNGQPLADEDRAKLTARGIRIEERPVRQLATEDGRLSAVELADGTRVRREAVFLVPRFESNGTLLDALGCEKDPDTGWTKTGVAGRTSVPGVWAAGNVVDPSAGVIAAAGAASVTGAQINAALVEADVEAAVQAAVQAAVVTAARS
ncbi:NAD(P)/FAD-dependent oxidoreductase [Catenulispora sp. NF23]|uniref:NAD(P)/FAD-dependent oxidoreductase n=1 Tax=Catenulispora pinistramenti TaxID=2705254 RepID=UPI001BA4DFCD|nr:NAD(P)/FAD-dependent oxidoreductase [Catenulispora pinistramenti]MBS2538150.1 NAD(P)/FAD-dependent oxidoreductase [Catenulispora pinistramenti]